MTSALSLRARTAGAASLALAFVLADALALAGFFAASAFASVFASAFLAVLAFAGFAVFSTLAALAVFSTFSVLSTLSTLAAAAFLVATMSLHRCQRAAGATTNPTVELRFRDQTQRVCERQAQPSRELGRPRVAGLQRGHEGVEPRGDRPHDGRLARQRAA